MVLACLSHRTVFISAVGEPPMCMSCSALFALKRAIEAARQELGVDNFFPLGKYYMQCCR